MKRFIENKKNLWGSLNFIQYRQTIKHILRKIIQPNFISNKLRILHGLRQNFLAIFFIFCKICDRIGVQGFN